MVYKVETGIKTHWFKTIRGAESFALKSPHWMVKSVEDGSELEWGRKMLNMDNSWNNGG